MAIGGQRAGKAGTIWERPGRPDRPPPVPLTREAIVAAAIGIADAEGLAAVSMRRVATALRVGPMRLYGYMATKEELLELMVDTVYGELASPSPMPSNWRAAIRGIAGRMRKAGRRHVWFVDLLGGRPHQGPNALAHLEASLQALTADPGFGQIDMVMHTVRAVNAYVIGAIRSELNGVLAQQPTHPIGLEGGQRLARTSFVRALPETSPT